MSVREIVTPREAVEMVREAGMSHTTSILDGHASTDPSWRALRTAKTILRDHIYETYGCNVDELHMLSNG